MTKIARYEIRSLCLAEMDRHLRETYDGAVKSVWAVGSPYSLGSGWNVNGIDISAHRNHEEGDKNPRFLVNISGSNIEHICTEVEKRFKDLKKIA